MIQDEFQAQTTMVLDKLTEAQDKQYRSSKSKLESTSVVRSQTSSVLGASSPTTETSKPATAQPFVFTACGVPPINSKSTQSSFPLRTPSLTGSSLFSFSATEQAANTTQAKASVFGICANDTTAVPKDGSGIQGSKSMGQHQSHSSQSKPSFSPSKANVMTILMKPVPVHSTQAVTSPQTPGFSLTDQQESEASVFRGCSPEQEGGPTVSFGSLSCPQRKIKDLSL